MNISSLEELKNSVLQANQNGTLITSKHDPQNLSNTYNSFRTVVSHEVADKIDDLIRSGEFLATLYDNNRFPNSPFYCVIEPLPGSLFTVPASGITANSAIPTSVLDRLVLVSGGTVGLHIFGEQNSSIEAEKQAGNLVNMRLL